MIARPALARVLGECEERREDVEAVSAASSAERRESWVVAKAEGSSGDCVGRGILFGRKIVVLWVYDAVG